MTIIDKILAPLAVACFVGFLAILGSFVLELNLIVILVIGSLMAIFDFLRSYRGNGG